MLFDLGVDRLPFVRVLASGPLTHSNKTGDVIRPSRFVGMRNFLVITLGLLERSAVPGAIGLPRTRRDRPSRRAAEKRDEIAPSHVVFPQMPQDRTIIVNPRVLADLRLATSSNLLGCWTGKSAGLAPSSSGPTQSAPTWQNNAGRRRPPEASRPHPPPEPPSLSQVVTVRWCLNLNFGSGQKGGYLTTQPVAADKRSKWSPRPAVIPYEVALIHLTGSSR